MTDSDTCPATNRNDEPCQLAAGWGTDNDSGPCKFHGGASSGAPEGNQNAATHGAYSKSFVENFLTDDEKELVDQARELLGTQEGAQENARLMASICQLQFRRTGDERFMRRYESICDTFGIAPADEMEVSGDVDLSAEVVVDFENADT